MAIPHEIPVGVLQEPKFSGAWEGGGPHPPSLLFFKWGVPSPHVPGQQGVTPLPFFFSSGGTLPPCAGATGGHPPPPSGPGPVRAIIVWKSSQHETSRAGSYGSLMNYTRYYNAAQKTDTNNFINHGVNG